MSSNEWHYMRDDQQVGPVSGAQLRQLASTGQLRPTDLVWKEGMAEWSPASRVKGLFGVAAPATPAAAAPVPARPVAASPQSPVMPTATAAAHAAQPTSDIAYYNPTAGMPARVAQTLKGFPPARGSRNEFPLSDDHLAQFALTEKHRKALRSFNSLCQLLALICVICSVGPVIALLAAGSGPRVFRGEPIVILAAVLGVFVAFIAVYYLAGKAALKCRIWGPITVTVLTGAGALWTLGSTAYTIMTEPIGPGSGDTTAAIIGIAVALLFATVFLTISIRAILAIPRFLACPVWAQEALVNAKL